MIGTAKNPLYFKDGQPRYHTSIKPTPGWIARFIFIGGAMFFFALIMSLMPPSLYVKSGIPFRHRQLGRVGRDLLACGESNVK
jgi:hypothetical protein